MDTLTIYEDYEAFKKENKNLIEGLMKRKSKIITRFSSVFAVVDYLYYENLKRKLSKDEQLIFSTGFDYIFDEFTTINSLLETKFNNNIAALDQKSKTINLLLYINDYKLELLNYNESIQNQVSLYNDLENKVYECLDVVGNVDDVYYAMLNDINYKIFESNNIEVNTVEEIFYQIAIELDLIPEDEFDIFNAVINKKLKER